MSWGSQPRERRALLLAALAALALPVAAAEAATRTADLLLNLCSAALALGFAVLHALLFLYYPRERGNLWFSLFAFGLTANGILDSVMTWASLAPRQQASLHVLNVLVIGGLLLSLAHFLASLQPSAAKVVLRWLAWAFVPVVLISMGPGWRDLYQLVYQTWIVAAAGVVVWIAVGTLRAGIERARILLVSASGFVLLIAAEIAKKAGALHVVGEIVFYGLALVLILGGASIFLARRLAKAAWELERLASDLEDRVAERTAELRRSELEALAASRAKTSFLATMSHEIRTPMNAIVGLSELLAGAGLGGREREMALTLRRSAVALLRLIDEVLDLSRIEAGRLTLERKPFAVETLVRDVGELFAPQVHHKVAFSWQLPAPTPPPLIGDPARLRQVLVNLVGNALKFTAEGRVEIRAVVADGWLRFEVEDTGIGIAPEALERLFQPFSQGDETTTRRFGGAGLGLAICRRLIEAMDGTIEVTSTPGRGSTFRVRVPAELATQPLPLSSSQEIPPAMIQAIQRQPLRILLAEDNEVNQLVTQLMLERLGEKATTVERGDAALERLEHEKFDLVLLDLHMPGMDGLDVARELRRRGDRTWLVALTASALPEDRERCQAAGMDDFLAKPVQLESLREALLRAGPSRALTKTG